MASVNTLIILVLQPNDLWSPNPNIVHLGCLWPDTNFWSSICVIFSTVAEPINSGKSAKSCKIQIHVDTYFETYLGYWGCLIAVNLQIYLETSSPQQANNIPKLANFQYKLAEFEKQFCKIHEIHKNMQNSLEIMSNTCRYIIFETYLGYWGCLIAINLSCKLSLITTMREQCPKTTRHQWCCEKLGISHDVKSLMNIINKNYFSCFHSFASRGLFKSLLRSLNDQENHSQSVFLAS